MSKDNIDPSIFDDLDAELLQEERYSLIVDDVDFHNMSQADAANSKASEGAWLEAQAAAVVKSGRDKVRAAIKKEVGDTDAILGTTADVTQLSAAAVLALIAAFKMGDTFGKFRTQFMGTIEALVPPTEGGADVYAQAQQFLSGVQSGDIILTAVLKGLPEVIAEMAGRSTGVATILAQAKAAAK